MCTGKKSTVRPGLQFVRLLRLPGIFTSIALACVSVTADEPVSDTPPATPLEIIERAEDRVADTQQALGNFDLGVLEPLSALNELYLDSGNIRQAENALDNRLEILRMNLGLHSAEQIPVLEEMLRLQALQRDWEGVDDAIAHLAWLYRRTTDINTSKRLEGISTLRDWALILLREDANEREASHILTYRDLSSFLKETAETVYADQSVESMPYIYQASLAEALIALTIVHKPTTGQELITRIEGIQGSGLPPGRRITSTADLEAVYGARVNTVWERSFRNHMVAHFQYLEELLAIAEHNDDGEAEAMLQLYMGDSMLIRQQFEQRIGSVAGPRRGRASTGSASRYYRQAHTALLDLGYDAARLSEHFGCPALLPMSTLHIRLDDYPGCQFDNDNARLPTASLLAPVMPGASYEPPDTFDDQADTPLTATLQFRVLRNGQINAAEVLSATPDNTGNRARMLRLARQLQFRPALSEEGQPMQTDVVMTTISPAR